MSDTCEVEGTGEAIPSPDLTPPDPKDEVATARRAALVSWFTVAITLLALFLLNGTMP